MNTIENNKIIMAFMGVKPKMEMDGVYSYSALPFFSVRKNDIDKVIYSMAEYLKYNSDWNLLMEVVEKIFTVEESIQDDLIFKLNDALLEVNKNSLYNACLNCIKWYNEQKN